MSKPIKLLTALVAIFIATQCFINTAQSQTKTLRKAQQLEGLNAPVVLSVMQDSKGFMWFTTLYGLVRYDGYTYKSYTYDPKDSTSIPNIIGISSLMEGNDGKIWIGTAQNLLVEFDPITESFTSYALDSTISNNYRNWVSTLYEDQQGIMWIGTQFEGFYRFDHSQNTFKLFRQQTEKPIHNKDFITAFVELDDQYMLIGTWEGLYELNRLNDSLQPFILKEKLPDGFDKAGFRTLHKDLNGCIWISCDLGLFKYNPRNKNITYFEHDPKNSNSISNGYVIDIYNNPLDKGQTLWLRMGAVINKINIHTGFIERYLSQDDQPRIIYSSFVDKTGLLWLASDNQGVYFIDLKDSPFQQFDIISNPPDTEKYSGTAFYYDSKDNFWVGTGQGGLFQYDLSGKLKRRVKVLPDSQFGSATLIYQFYEDSKNHLWITQWADGVYSYDFNTRKLERHLLLFPVADLPISRNSEIVEDANGRLWVGTATGPFYAELNKPDNIQFTWVDHPVLGMAFVRTICKDQDGSIWFGTQQDGVFYLSHENLDSLNFTHYRHDPKNSESLSSNNILSIHCDNDGSIWIGTNIGLNRFNPEKKTFKYYNADNGFNAELIFCVNSDNSGHIWASTENGIARYNPNAKTFKLLSKQDGIPYENIYPYHFDKGKDGKFYVGGVRGFGLGYYSFHPDSIQENSQPPQVWITDFKVRNEYIELDTSISFLSNINLKHHQNFFTIEFASLDFHDPDKNQYAYQLEGVDDDWVYSGNRRIANYSGMTPGNYIFRVKGSNNDGIWNETGTKIRIIIDSPPWKTWWAYLIYSLLIVGILFIIIRYYLRRQHLLLQLELEHMEAEKLKDIDSLKSRFFANISHEFRTPLTLILGPIQKLRQKLSDATSIKDFDIMERNANHLQRLINQILDLTKLEAGKLQLKTSEINIVSFLKSYIQSFESLARQRNIEFIFQSDQDEIKVFVDREKLEQIINNLISNAFKYSSSGDTIQVSISSGIFPETEVKSVNIEIADTGKGIKKEDIPFLFDRFYQAANNEKSHGGSGIGLTLVKELVELHHGIIHVSSEFAVGTIFCVYFRLGADHLNENEIIKYQAQSEEEELKVSSTDETEKRIIVEKEQDDVDFGAPTLLIVEDNADMREYIKGYLEKNYQTVIATNGKEGFKKAIEFIPDIIISDVMMPEMNGIEMCQQLKSDERTSHIPVILLTARSSGADKIEGLATGADDFITKPFDAEELQVRIKNLITQREKLSTYYKTKIASANNAENLKLAGQQIASMDEKFLKKALKIVEEHMADEQFGVENFSTEMAFSRMQLHRKLKGLTGQSSTEFIRNIRLNKAAKLLASNAGTVTEIAFQVGFNNLSWFTRCFKEQYGMSPTEFTQE